MKKFLAIMLAAAAMLSAAACGSTDVVHGIKKGVQVEESTAALSDEEYFDSVFTPVIRFVVASDVHITDEVCNEEKERLAAMFSVAYDYADAQEDYTALDAVWFAGDYCDQGTWNSMVKFRRLVEENIREGTQYRTILGNHEYYHDPENTVLFMKETFGYDSEDAHITVGDFHFIFLSPDENGKGYSEAKQKWLSEQLEIAYKDDPTGQRPIFVFQHHHVKNTVYGSVRWGVEDLTEVLSTYPQVIDFSGHSHFPINDPRSVWQGAFTCLGTGTLSYGEYGIAGLYPDSVWPADDCGGYTTTEPWAAGGEKVKDTAQFYIVEVDANYAVKVQGYDLLSDSFFMEPLYFRSVGDPELFTYTEARAETSETPYWPFETEYEAELDEEGILNISFTQAACADTVQNYRCELYAGHGDGELLQTEYRLSDTMYVPAPELIRVTFAGLDPMGDYTVKIIPVSSWEKEGEALEFTLGSDPEN